tara:strand:+ start:2672 stop:3298 length:627 start_codon:yes stop_codon:yes gene_type:complete
MMNEETNEKLYTHAEVVELQREQEQELTKNVAFDSIILVIAILLYESSDFIKYYDVYYVAAFFGIMAFSFHIAFRFVWRGQFEDSAYHRKRQRREKRRMKQEMSDFKIKLENDNQRRLFTHQMNAMKAQYELSMADGTISPGEAQVLQQNEQALMQQLSPDLLSQAQAMLAQAKSNIPNVRVTQPPLGQVKVTPAPDNKIDLDPSNKN